MPLPTTIIHFQRPQFAPPACRGPFLSRDTPVQQDSIGTPPSHWRVNEKAELTRDGRQLPPARTRTSPRGPVAGGAVPPYYALKLV
jgi:hypothetical protein